MILIIYVHPHNLIFLLSLLLQSQSPVKKIEKQKNKLKDLVESEIRSKQSQPIFPSNNFNLQQLHSQ